jgi:hypothetical protein
VANQQGQEYSDDRPARLWIQGEEFDSYIQALQWVRTTVEALNLPRGTGYHIVEAWPSQGIVKMAAKLTGVQVEGAPLGNRRMDYNESRIREMVWHVQIANGTPASFEQIYTALSQGAAQLRQAQAAEGPIVWAVERTVDQGKDEQGNIVENNIIRVVVPVSRIWLDWP